MVLILILHSATSSEKISILSIMANVAVFYSV
jgi:hypothetical protein